MRLAKIFKPKIIVALILLSLIIGLVGSLLFSCAERIFYPREYREYVIKYSEKYGVPKELVFAVIKAESGFDSDAVSSAGAIGLMQIMPSTCDWLAKHHLNESASALSLYDPETNIKYGTYYLQYLFSKFGSWEKAVIAYNWGEGNFSEFLDSEGYTDGEYSSIPVRETRNYVKKVMSYKEKYEKLYK